MATKRTFWDVVDSRVSCREFSQEKVTAEEVSSILRAAQRSPSAGNLQARRIFIVEDKEILKKLANAAYDQQWIATAPIVFVFCAEYERSSWKYGKRGERLYCIQDATIACSYAQLACEAIEGLGSCWVGAFDEGLVASILGAEQPRFRPVSLLVVGKPATQSKRKRSKRLALAELVKVGKIRVHR
mmetsp:Transcript_3069/g.4148  ORF Transcript_3069/g.4148 Transcript_3069/m.4148 type:complete len:186 (-) Transcript_3069:251-808(-)